MNCESVVDKKSRLYRLWYTMNSKCKNEKNEEYKNYGALGIKVCEDWATDFISFADWAIKNDYNDSSVIIRINNKGDFEPNNCKIVSKEDSKKQQCNRVKITFNGKEELLSDLVKRFGLDYKKALYRIQNGDTIEDIFKSVKRSNISYVSKEEKKSSLYKTWLNVKYQAKRYNIQLSEDWYDYLAFKEWAKEMGYVDGCTVRRIDKSLGYSKDNCLVT